MPSLLEAMAIQGSTGHWARPSTSNMPGSRAGAASWIDTSGNLWLFGGDGVDGSGSLLSGYLNDLWMYSPGSGTWTWVGGSSTLGASGVYGTQGWPSTSNVPGARSVAAYWTDLSGNFWLFGGFEFYASQQPTGSTLETNDLWEYTPPLSQTSSNGSTRPTCVTVGKNTICFVKAGVHPCSGEDRFCRAVCDHPCGGAVVSWTQPFNDTTDNSLDGISVNIPVATREQANTLAAELRVEVSTESYGQDISGRITSGKFVDHGTSGLDRVAVVGPLVDVRARLGTSQHLASSTTRSIAELSLPYVATITPGAHLRMVKYDERKGRWLDVGAQSMNVSKHLITARVSTVGRYTIVAEMAAGGHQNAQEWNHNK